MSKEENIVSYTAEELRTMKNQSQTDFSHVDALTDEEAEKAALSDPDNLPLKEGDAVSLVLIAQGLVQKPICASEGQP